MTTRPDPNTPETPQKAVDGPQGGLEGASGHAETPRGANGPQHGAERFQTDRQPRGPVDWARQQAAERDKQPTSDLQQHIANTIRDTPARYPDDIAAAVLNAPELKRLIAQAAALERVRHLARRAAHRTEAGLNDWQIGQHELASAVLDLLTEQPEPEQPAHNAGPSIREAADADRLWWNGEKAGEQ